MVKIIITKDSLTTPKILGYLSEEAIESGAFEYVDGVYAFDTEGVVLSSAISLICKKPMITKELIERLDVEVVPETINLVFVTFSVDEHRGIIKEIREVRNRGIKIDTLVSALKIPENIRKELMLFGINCISLYEISELRDF